MSLSRWRTRALSLSVLGLVACSDRPAVTDPETIHDQSLPLAVGPVALLQSADPTAIPIGSPTRIDFLGRAAAARGSVLFPLGAPPSGHEEFTATAREWLAGAKASQSGGPADPRARQRIQFVERLLAAGTPEEIRAALGPERARVVGSRSATPRDGALVEHVARFRLDGRELLRVVTFARPSGARALAECVDDPDGLALYPSDTCDYYDPYFDPEPVAADVAVMQAGIDAASVEIEGIEAVDVSYAANCAAERSAYLGSLLAFTWRASETLWWAWNRNVPKTYTSLRDASILYGATYALYLRYKECMAGKARGDA